MCHSHKISIFILTFSISLHAWAAENENLSGKEAFHRAIDQINNGNHAAAIPLLKHSDSKLPDVPSVLWNLGISAIITEDYELASSTWSRYRKIAPNDWESLPKSIQTYQGLGNFPDRDNTRSALMSLYSDGRISSLTEQIKYCREQYPLEGGRVFIYEYFKPFSSKWVKFYEAFYVDKSGKISFSVSMGSYETTNQIDLELGNHGEDERLYHFDIYTSEGTHQTVGFYTATEPLPYNRASEVLRNSVASRLTQQMETKSQ